MHFLVTNDMHVFDAQGFPILHFGCQGAGLHIFMYLVAKVAQMMDAAITNRRLTVSEARALDNRPPLTNDQEAEFARLFPTRSATTTQGVNL